MGPNKAMNPKIEIIGHSKRLGQNVTVKVMHIFSIRIVFACVVLVIGVVDFSSIIILIATSGCLPL